MKSLFQNVIKTSHPKGIGLAMNYINPSIPKEKQKLPPHPVVFEKALSSLIQKPATIKFDNVNAINHEVELGVIIGKKGKNISVDNWKEYIGGYFLLIDFTYVPGGILDDGVPWMLRKSADDFFVVGDYIAPEKVQDPHNLHLELKINGFVAQEGSTKNMTFKIPEQLAYVSKFMTINEGDLILTGTPVGIGPIKDQDLLEATLRQDSTRLDALKFAVTLNKSI